MSDWIDISRGLHDGMAGWPGDPPFRLRPVTGHGDGAMVSKINTSLHVGTHIDAPRHVLAGGADVASLPLGQLCGPALVIDLPRVVRVDVADFEAGIGNTADGVADGVANGAAGGTASADPGCPRLLIRRCMPPAMPGDLSSQASDEGLTVEAARWLAGRGLALLGLDTASPDRPDDADLPVHRVLAEAGVAIVENLDLRHLAPGAYELIALPLPVAGAEAAPARVVVRRVENREWRSETRHGGIRWMQG